MKNQQKGPFEEEFRASQVYQTLSGSGSFVADKIAQGLGKAAEGIDTAISHIASGSDGKEKPSGNRAYRSYDSSAGRTESTRPNGPASPGPSGYYRYPGPQRQTPPVRNRASAPPPGGNQAPPFYRNQTGPVKVNPVPPPKMKVVRGPSVAKYYITGVFALLYALSFPLYRPAHYGVFALVLFLVFLLSGMLFKGKKQFVPLEEEKPAEKPREEEKREEKKEEKRPSTGDPEVDKVIEEGEGYLKKLRAANDAIPDESMSEDIERMEKASAGIFQYIAEHPAKAPQIRKFMSYYLPTTLKLLNSYQRLAAQKVKGETITSTMFNIAGMMHTVADAFEKQLDSLFSDEAMDISADITVFETLLKQEGFVEENEKGKR